jgi:hypothetical protein
MMRAFALSILVLGVSATLMMLVLILGIRSACKLAMLFVDSTENMPSNPDIIRATHEALSKKELKHPITREKITHQKM